jgi:hypothetical protein
LKEDLNKTTILLEEIRNKYYLAIQRQNELENDLKKLIEEKRIEMEVVHNENQELQTQFENIKIQIED